MYTTERRFAYLQVSFYILSIFLNSSRKENNKIFFRFSCSDGERLTIELGRALRNGEYKCKVHYMKLSEITETNENLTFLCDWILCNGATVGNTKREILAQIATNDPPLAIPYERCRLRKKYGAIPAKIYLDNEVFGDDIILLSHSEVSIVVSTYIYIQSNEIA